MLFRYDGKEFLICMPGLPGTNSIAYVEKIKQHIASNSISVDSGKTVSVTISFGIADLRGNRLISDTISAADNALYKAKGNGRNRIEYAA